MKKIFLVALAVLTIGIATNVANAENYPAININNSINNSNSNVNNSNNQGYNDPYAGNYGGYPSMFAQPNPNVFIHPNSYRACDPTTKYGAYSCYKSSNDNVTISYSNAQGGGKLISKPATRVTW